MRAALHIILLSLVQLIENGMAFHPSAVVFVQATVLAALHCVALQQRPGWYSSTTSIYAVGHSIAHGFWRACFFVVWLLC